MFSASYLRLMLLCFWRDFDVKLTANFWDDKCSAWSHGPCVGVESKEQAPKVFVCEACASPISEISSEAEKPPVWCTLIATDLSNNRKRNLRFSLASDAREQAVRDAIKSKVPAATANQLARITLMRKSLFCCCIRWVMLVCCRNRP